MCVQVRGYHFLRKGVINLQKVSINKITTPLFRQQKFYEPHHRYTLPPKQAKIVLKSVFLNKITHYVHLVTPYILIIKNCMTPYFSFKNFMTPSIFGTPSSKENDSTLKIVSVSTVLLGLNPTAPEMCKMLNITLKRRHSIQSLWSETNPLKIDILLCQKYP